MGAFGAFGCAGRRRKLSGGVVDRFLPMLRNLRKSSGLTKVMSRQHFNGKKKKLYAMVHYKLEYNNKSVKHY